MTIADKKVFKNQNPFLRVALNIDPDLSACNAQTEEFDINNYEAFLTALCEEREY